VEIRRGGGRAGDRHVALSGELQETLDSSGRVVGTLTFVTVRKQQDKTGVLTPLLFRRRDEFVDDRLRAVCEVTELRFPQHESIGVSDRIPVFESHRTEFGKKRVVDPETSLVLGEVE
jgi:hypothetical protein